MKGPSGKIGHMVLLRCFLWEIGHIVSMKGLSGKIDHIVSMLHPSKILAGKRTVDNPSGTGLFSYFTSPSRFSVGKLCADSLNINNDHN